MLSRASGLRTAALFGLLLSGAVAGGCDQAITGTRENAASQPPPSQPPPAPPLVIVPSSLDLLVGQTAQLRTVGADPSSFHWASSDQGVASVSGSGVVTAGRVGTATITAGGASATVYVLEKGDRGHQ